MTHTCMRRVIVNQLSGTLQALRRSGPLDYVCEDKFKQWVVSGLVVVAANTRRCPWRSRPRTVCATAMAMAWHVRPWLTTNLQDTHHTLVPRMYDAREARCCISPPSMNILAAQATSIAIANISSSGTLELRNIQQHGEQAVL